MGELITNDFYHIGFINLLEEIYGESIEVLPGSFAFEVKQLMEFQA